VTPGALVVRGGEVLTPDGRARGDLVIRGGRLSFWPRSARDTELSAARTLDATGLVVAPGFIDLQCNGAGGVDLTAEPERLWEVAAILPRWGVTAWLPTIVTSPDEVRRRAFAALADLPPGRTFLEPERSPSGHRGSKKVQPGSPVGAVPLGLHFEGPFLAPERRGAHASAHLRTPDPAVIDGWSREAGVAMVTLAPELPGALDLVRRLVARDVVVSLGHSSAPAAQAAAAVEAGARSVTHLFSAMTGLHHREPGLVGVALTDERLTVGVIADGVHLHPGVVDLAARALGPRLALVTDAVAALGVAHGPVRLGDLEAMADGDSVRLADGTLAGSVLSLDRAVGNLMAFAGVGLDEAVRAATATPARLLGLEAERGAIVSGMVGDLALLDPVPDGPEVVATVIGGTVAYDRRTAGSDGAGDDDGADGAERSAWRS
jgi:N-acetylglucosamine-6-phosphate deacetylase